MQQGQSAPATLPTEQPQGSILTALSNFGAGLRPGGAGVFQGLADFQRGLQTGQRTDPQGAQQQALQQRIRPY